MKKNRLAISAMILSAIIVYGACRKIDMQPEKEEMKVDHKFFNLYQPTDKSVLAVQSYMKREESKYHFVKEMVTRIGFPRWDKAMIFEDGTGQVYNRSSIEDTATIVYLPFVRPAENFVNTVMTFRMTSLDTSWRGLCDWQYDELSSDTTYADSTRWSIRDGFNVFATLDRAIFGYNEFEVTDGRVFGRNETDTLLVTLDPQGSQDRNGNVQRSNQYYYSFICHTHEICEPVTAGRGNSLGVNCYTTTWCTIVFVGGGSSGGWWPWESGGGGGTGGGYIPPPQCPPVAQRGADTSPGCRPRGWRPFNSGGGGSPQPPNDSTIAARLNRLMEKTMLQLNIDSLHNKGQQEVKEKTFSFNRNGGDTSVMNILTGQSHSSQPTLFFSSSFGFFHTHIEDDPTGGSDKNQCFDGPDIYKLYKNAVIDRYPLTVSIISTRDYFYAIVITDFNKLKKSY